MRWLETVRASGESGAINKDIQKEKQKVRPFSRTSLRHAGEEAEMAGRGYIAWVMGCVVSLDVSI